MHHEPGVRMRHGLIKKTIGLPGRDVGRVLPFVADGRGTVAGHSGVPVLIGVGIEDKVAAIEAAGVGTVVVLD